MRKKRLKKLKKTKEATKAKEIYRISIVFLPLKIPSVGSPVGPIPSVNAIFNCLGRLAARINLDNRPTARTP